MYKKNFNPAGVMLLASIWIFTACQQQESFQEKKINLRQSIDEAILDTDKQIEGVMETVADSTSRSGRIDALRDIRQELDADLNKLSGVSEGEWAEFRQQVETSLKELDRLIAEIRSEEMPKSYPMSN